MDLQALFAKAIPALESLYDKTATVYRYQEVEKLSGATGMEWVPVYTDIPCRISTVGARTLDNAEQTAATLIQSDEKLFCSSSYELLEGDRFTVAGVEYETSQRPFRYMSHQEILLKFRGYA